MRAKYAEYQELILELYLFSMWVLGCVILVFIGGTVLGILFDFKPTGEAFSTALWAGVVLYALFIPLWWSCGDLESAIGTFVGAVMLSLCIYFDLLFLGGIFATIIACIAFVGIPEEL